MSDNYGVPQQLIADLVKVEKKRAEIEKTISDAALRNVGVKAGEIMRNKYSGLHHQVKGFSVYVNDGRVKISAQAYRYYQSGRRKDRTAHSSSFISFEDLERIE